jgi:hypothetical protein
MPVVPSLLRCALPLLFALACGAARSEQIDSAGSADGIGPDEATEAGPASGGEVDDSESGGALFDVADGHGSAGDDDSGCQKMDFLFVVDNSGSMADDQTRMIEQFPGLLEAIRQDVGIEDYHVMVVDTDWGGSAKCTEDPACAEYLEMIGSNADNSDCHEAVVETPCEADPADLQQRVECDWLLGAGVTFPLGTEASNERCEFESGKRWFDHTEPNPAAAFACAAKVGAGGSGVEHQIESLDRALSAEMLAAGGCNEGFLRDDAILVITFLTDEGQWWSDNYQDELQAPVIERVLQAKGGNEDAVVLFGLLDDSFKMKWLEYGLCLGNPESAGDEILDFIMKFRHGTWGSLCHEDWRELFADALELIELTCDNFVPPG